MKKDKFIRRILLLVIFTLTTAVIGVIMNVYRAANQSKPSQATSAQLEPLNPKIDTSTIKDILSRENLVADTQEATSSQKLK